MKVAVENEDLKLAAMRPPTSHRRAEGAHSASGQVPEMPAASWRLLTTVARKRLSSLKHGPGLVLSLYVNLDPASFAVPSARETEVQAVIDAARAEAHEAWGTLDHDGRQALEGDLERAHGYLLTELAPDGAGAAALFACAQRGMFEAFTIGPTVPTQGRARNRAYIRPLFEMELLPDFAILAVDRRWARVLVSRGGGVLHQVAEIESRARSHHRRSWLEGAVDNDTDQHVKKAAMRLINIHRARKLEVLLLACTEEMMAAVQRRLGAELQPLLLGRVPWDPQQDDPAELTHAALPLIRQRERRLEEALMERVHIQAGSGAGALGIVAVLDALNSKTVETILLETGVQVPGAVCRACGWLAPESCDCPACGQPMNPQPDLVEYVLRRALEQSADVRFGAFMSPDSGEHRQLAAVLRAGFASRV